MCIVDSEMNEQHWFLIAVCAVVVAALLFYCVYHCTPFGEWFEKKRKQRKQQQELVAEEAPGSSSDGHHSGVYNAPTTAV